MGSNETIGELTEIISELRQKKAEVDTKIQAFETALAEVRERRGLPKLGSTPPAPEGGLQAIRRQMLVDFAKKNRGVLFVRKSLDTLVNAGFYRDRAQARTQIYRLIAAMESWRKVRPGIYQLVEDTETSPASL